MNHICVLAIILLTLNSQIAAAETVFQINTTGQAPLNTSEQTGFMDEVAGEAFKRIGITLKTVRLPAERGLKSANKGIVDGEMSRIKGLSKKYTNLVIVPEKIMDWEFVAFSYKPINMRQGWSSLSDKLVGHLNGWKILENNIPASAEITKTTNDVELFTLLEKRRVDYAVYELWAGRSIINNNKMKDVKLCEPAFAVKEMFIYLHKKHQTLTPKLAKALANMKKDGTYNKLVNKHLTPLI